MKTASTRPLSPRRCVQTALRSFCLLPGSASPGKSGDLKTNGNSCTHLELVRVIGISHHPTTPRPPGTAPDASRIGFDISRCPAPGSPDPDILREEVLHTTTPRRRKPGRAIHLVAGDGGGRILCCSQAAEEEGSHSRVFISHVICEDPMVVAELHVRKYTFPTRSNTTLQTAVLLAEIETQPEVFRGQPIETEAVGKSTGGV